MRRLLSCFVILTLFSGCALGPDYERPPVPEYEKYREAVAAGDSIVNLNWWDLYQDQRLKDLINTALDNNKDIGIAMARMNESRAFLGLTRADQFPELNIEGGMGRQEFTDSSNGYRTTEGNLLAGAAFYELDLWGKNRRSTEAARAELMSSEQTFRTVVIGLVADVASFYFLLRDFDERLEVSRRTLKSRQGSTAIIRARRERGYVSDLDLNQAEIEEALAEAAVSNFERGTVTTENALSVLLGKGPGAIRRGNRLEEQPVPPLIPAGLPSELVKRRPDVLSAEQKLIAQSARIGVAEALRFPSIGLTGGYGIESADLSSFDPGTDAFWSFGVNLIGPLLSYNRNISRVEIEEARTEQLAVQYQKTILQAFREVEDALVGVRTYRTEHEARKKQTKAASNAARLSRARYDAGESSYLEVLDAERSLFSAEIASSSTLRNYFVSLVKLYKALGGGWSD